MKRNHSLVPGPGLMPATFYTGIIWLISIWWVAIGAAILRMSPWFWLNIVAYGGGFGAMFAGALAVYWKGGVRGWRWLSVSPLLVFCAGMVVTCFVSAIGAVTFASQASRFEIAPSLLAHARQVMQSLEHAATNDRDRFPAQLPRDVAEILTGARHPPARRIVYCGGGIKMRKNWSGHIVFFVRPSIWDGWRVVGYADGRVAIANGDRAAPAQPAKLRKTAGSRVTGGSRPHQLNERRFFSQ